MEINIVDILAMIEKMVQDNIIGQMVTVIKEIFQKTWDREKVKCFGMMVALTQGNGKEAYLMEKVVMFLTKQGIFKVKG